MVDAQIKIVVSGGTVQAVYSSNPALALNVVVLDTDDIADETSEKEAEARVEEETKGYENIY